MPDAPDPAFALPDDDPVPTPPPAGSPDGWAVAALFAPLPFVVLMFLAVDLNATERLLAVVGYGSVFLSAVLAAIDAAVLRAARPPGRRSEAFHPLPQLIGIALFWIVCYPLHFYRRTQAGGRNLVVPGVLVTLLYAAGAVHLLAFPRLPRADHPDVVGLITGMLCDGEYGNYYRPIDGRVHLSDLRHVGRETGAGGQSACRGAGTMRFGEETYPFEYVVHWSATGRGEYLVDLAPGTPHMLPVADAVATVGQVLGRVRQSPLAQARGMDASARLVDARTLSFDPAAGVRQCRATLRSNVPDIAIGYELHWLDRPKGEWDFEVWVIP